MGLLRLKRMAAKKMDAKPSELLSNHEVRRLLVRLGGSGALMTGLPKGKSSKELGIKTSSTTVFFKMGDLVPYFKRLKEKKLIKPPLKNLFSKS